MDLPDSYLFQSRPADVLAKTRALCVEYQSRTERERYSVYFGSKVVL
jgi:hypothetical protein